MTMLTQYHHMSRQKKSLGTIVLGFYPIWKHYAGLDDAGLDVNNVPTMISEVLHPDALQHLL